MTPTLEVLFTPAEFRNLSSQALSGTVCVVFDVLRATTTMLVALVNGAEAIIPASEIEEALAWRVRDPQVLLAGERQGLRIDADLTGGVNFDFGNSPREFTPSRVAGRTVVLTTTNGTRALRACCGAQRVLIGALVNLGALSRWIVRQCPPQLLLVCSGTLEQPAYEDALAAGALCEEIWPQYSKGVVADSVHIARHLYLKSQENLLAASTFSRNARRLLAHPDLRDDVPLCYARDRLKVLAELCPNGRVCRMADSA